VTAAVRGVVCPAQGHAGKAADVYAFGVFMFELFTGAKPWDGLNPAEIIYAVTAAQKRPVFPLHVPVAVVQLASDCWHHDAEKRPAFDEICDRITDMLSELTMEHVVGVCFAMEAPSGP